jgi:hypothetical protein
VGTPSPVASAGTSAFAGPGLKLGEQARRASRAALAWRRWEPHHFRLLPQRSRSELDGVRGGVQFFVSALYATARSGARTLTCLPRFMK